MIHNQNEVKTVTFNSTTLKNNQTTNRDLMTSEHQLTYIQNLKKNQRKTELIERKNQSHSPVMMNQYHYFNKDSTTQ